MSTVTPLMQQYLKLKKEYHDTLLFFQVGDFYELFFDDAKQASSFLGITLTKRGKHNGDPIPLCGVPVHALDHYLAKLIRGGFKVAIADQLTEAKPGTVVERGVTKVLTPGTLTDAHLLDEKSASYLFSFYSLEDTWGLLFGELLTAQLFATQLPATSEKILESELVRFFPDEILLAPMHSTSSFAALFRRLGYCTTIINDDVTALVDNGTLRRWMHKQFDAKVRREVESQESLRLAFASFYAYLHKNQQHALEQFRTVQLYHPDDYLVLDGPTQRNLELVKNNQEGSRKNTLLQVVDHALTGMGSRMIKKWVLRPLTKKESIVQRQESIQILVTDIQYAHAVQKLLTQVGDIERVIGRIALHRATLQDYGNLSMVLALLPQLYKTVTTRRSTLLEVIASYLTGFEPVRKLLDAAINSDFTLPWTIKKGFNQELDRMRDYAEKGNQKILELEKSEQKKTKITSLKIRYNKVHGYYLEVTKANLDRVPDYFIRIQTLVGRERFVTPELQQLQHEIVTAHNSVEDLEKQLFEQVKLDVYEYVTLLRKLAHALAHLDALWGLAHCAYHNQYVCPTLNDARTITIVKGRHPVVEVSLDNPFIPNDTCLTDESSLWIVTGPNMGGKSTYLRQVALIAVLAHTGSFVPAASADIALLDRIFTRIGAGDNLAEGKSTFLVEMEETATICKQATKKSLIILDEVGRGTSTFDGLALAHAIVEYLYTQVQARCLFATHYHELNQLSNEYPGIVSYHAESKKTDQGILLLHKIVPGIADGSFGIEVAKLAALPDSVITRSQELLTVLTTKQSVVDHPDTYRLADKLIQLQEQNSILRKHGVQLQKIHKILTDLDYENLSPKQAFDLLWKWREKS